MASKFYSGKEVVDFLQIRPFELAEHIREGRLEPFNRYGQKIPKYPIDRYGNPIDPFFLRGEIPDGDYVPCGCGKPFSEKELQEAIQKRTEHICKEVQRRRPIAEIRKYLGKAPWPEFWGLEPKALEEYSEEDAKERAIRDVAVNPHWIDHSWRFFRLPNDPEQANQKLSRMMAWMFKRDEVEQVKKKRSDSRPSTVPKNVPLPNDQSSLPGNTGGMNEGARPRNRNQKRWDQCRDLVRGTARDKWRKHPKKTIAEMIFDDEINSIPLVMELSPTERTLRKWIKDLAPDNRPGRRPKNRDLKKPRTT